MTWQKFIEQSIYDHFKFGSGTIEISKDGVDKMMAQDFGQTFTSVFNEFNKVLQKIEQLDLRDNKTFIALNMDDVFFLENNESNEALIFFIDDQLHIEHRELPENSVCFSTREVLQIIKFCLSNGLQLPQDEDEKE